MTDIATLGISIDSRDAVTAKKALDDLTASAKPAANAAADIGKQTASAAKGADALSVSASRAANTGAKQLTTQTSLARYELINLSRQFQDVGVSLASGQSPLLVLIQQGTQIADVFSSSEGTVGGFFKQVVSGAAAILSPLRLVVGGVAAIGAAAVASVFSWQSAQRDISLAMMGIGRASGVTAGDINKIASETSSLNGLSTSQAREVATALAATGKIGVDNVKLLTSNTKNFAAILGLDVPKAAEAMAKIFANPTEGAKQLAQSIGGIDSQTLKYIETLEQQGDRQAAIKVLADAVAPAIAKASDQTGFFARGWNSLTNTLSNGYNALGKAISQVGTNGLGQQAEEDLEKQRKSLEALIQDWQTAKKPQFDINAAMQQLAAVNDALMQIQTNKKAALETSTAQTTLQVGPLISQLAPAADAIRNVTANVDLLAKAMSDPAFEAFRQKVGEQLPLALARLQNMKAAFEINPRLADPIQSEIDALSTQNKLLNDQSPAMRQRVAYQLAFNDAVKQGASASEAAAIATARGKQAYGGTATDIQQAQQYIALLGQTATAADAAKQVDLQVQAAHLQGINIDKDRVAILRQLAVEQSIGVTQIKSQADAQRVEAATVGMSVGATAEYTAVQNQLNAAKLAHRDLSPENIADIQREAAALGQAASQADLLKSAYTGLVQGPLQAFTSAIANGSSAWDAFKKAGQSALTSIASKLADIAAQNLWKSAFGGGSGLLSLFGLGGGAAGGAGSVGVVGAAGGMAVPTYFADGGYTGPGGKYEPAGIVHRGEYVVDAATTSRIGVSNLNRLRGYADGGLVDSRSGFSIPRRAGNDNGSGSAGGIRVSVGVTVDNDGNLQAYVKSISQDTANQTVSGALKSPAFADHVALANRRSANRRLG